MKGPVPGLLGPRARRVLRLVWSAFVEGAAASAAAHYGGPFTLNDEVRVKAEGEKQE